MNLIEITKEDLIHLPIDILVSFFDGNIERNHFEFGLFRAFFDDKSQIDISIFNDSDAIQVNTDFLEMTVCLQGTANRSVILTSREDIIAFICFFCDVTNTRFLLSHNGILLKYLKEDLC